MKASSNVELVMMVMEWQDFDELKVCNGLG